VVFRLRDLASRSNSSRDMPAKTIRKLFSWLGVLSLAVAFATRVAFTWGAYGFEASTTGPEPRPRWLAQRSTIPVYGPQPLWVFKTHVLTRAGTFHIMRPAGEAVTLDVTKDDDPYVPMFSKGSFWPSRYGIVFDTAFDAGTRRVAGQIVYPPLLLSMALLMIRGAGEPEAASHGMSIGCLDDCMLAFLHDKQEPVSVSLETESAIPVDLAASATGFRNFHVSLDARSEQFPLKRTASLSANGSERLVFEIPAGTPWYRLHIQTNRIPVRALIAETTRQ
jgi:hypothetical protein